MTTETVLTDEQIYRLDEGGAFIGNIKEIARAIEQAVLQSDRIRTMDGMAACMDMVRQELIQADVITDKVPPMFVANAVIAQVQALRKDAREAAETLATAIYKCAQKLGIANSDHSHLSVAQCLHLLDCIGGTAIPNGFDTESRWTKEHVRNYPEAAAECLNRLLGHEPPQFTSAHKTPYALPSHVMDDIRRYGNECVAFGRAEAIPQEIKP